MGFYIFSFPGQKKSLNDYGPISAGGKAAAADDDDDDDDDDDIDLFGSDDEADAAAEKLKEQRLAEYAAKKAKSKIFCFFRDKLLFDRYKFLSPKPCSLEMSPASLHFQLFCCLFHTEPAVVAKE